MLAAETTLDISPIVIALVGLVSALGGAAIPHLFMRGKTKAEGGQVVVDAATDVVALVRSQMDELHAQNVELKKQVEALQAQVTDLNERLVSVFALEAERDRLAFELEETLKRCQTCPVLLATLEVPNN